MRPAAEIETEAARWLLAQEEAGWGEAEQAELDAWLAASPAHQAAFWRLEHGWRRADRIAARPVQAPPPARRPWRRAAAAAAACALVLAGGAVWLARDYPGRVYATEIGGHEVAPLADGSRIELNTDTRVRSDISPEHRTVWLDRGEAYFEVAHDAGRPFVIYAGKRRVTVLGTKFSVRRVGDEVRVTVVEGKVRVDALQPQKPAPPAVLTPGQSILTDGAAALVTPRSVEAAQNALSWRRGMLVFDNGYTVARAAEEFNRYNRRKIVVTSPEAGAIRIGGTFEVENIDGFVELLEQGYGLTIEKQGEEVKIAG